MGFGRKGRYKIMNEGIKIFIKRQSKQCQCFIIAIVCGCIIMVINACNTKEDSTFPQITHLAFQSEKNGKWGLIGVDGRVLFENQLDSKPSYVVNGIFRTLSLEQKQQTKSFRYYSLVEGPKQIGTLEGYKDGGICSEGIIPVVANGERIHYINANGETMFYLSPYNGSEILVVSSFFTNQRAWFMSEDYKFGFIDTKGNVVIEPIYDEAYPFYNGKAIVYNEEKEKWAVIDTEGNELFTVNAKRHEQQIPYSLFYKGNCVIAQFLYNENGERIQRMPFDMQTLSPIEGGIMLAQNSNTRRWQEVDMNGKLLSPSYSHALGIIDNIMYVGDTISGQVSLNDFDKNKNIYALNKKGEVLFTIKNCASFFPLYDKIVTGEDNNYYFVDKNGKSINNKSYYYISVPPYTHAPGYPLLWTFLCAPRTYENYNLRGVTSSYINDTRTVGSILKKLTNTGFGDLKIGQSGVEIAKMFNLKKFSGWLDLEARERGINWIYADVSIGLMPPNADVFVIKLNIDTTYLPIDNAQERISKAITEYLENVMKMERIDNGESYIYQSDEYSYNIIYWKGKTEFFLMDKSLMEE